MNEKYISTRGGIKNLSASECIVHGIAEDGGLFVPSFIHDLHLNLEDLQNKNYVEIAFDVFKLFLDDFNEEELKKCIHAAYKTGKFDAEEPVVLKEAGGRYFLELYHGPTAAFKDMALTILPHFMTAAMRHLNLDKEVVILTATSGDTGKAALAGFADVDKVKIIVYYPKDGVSTIQKQQMVTQTGQNTCVIGVDGNFDDTQNGVKAILNNPEIVKSLETEGYLFSSANSINIGRLLPQIVYYVYSYLQLVKNNRIKLGEKVNFAVPTGNFGNILAGYYASLLGIPVGRFISASNKNNVLSDFFNTGSYNRNRSFYKTISPSMDILISSNLERLLFDLSEGNTDFVTSLMHALNTKGCYSVDADFLEKASLFFGGYADESATAETIKNFFNHCGYLMDPHTAVANKVYDDYLAKTNDTTPAVILSTASPYKFGHAVYESIYGSVPDDMDDYDVLDLLSEKTNTVIPKPLQNLKQQTVLHQRTTSPSEMGICIKDFLHLKEENDK